MCASRTWELTAVHSWTPRSKPRSRSWWVEILSPTTRLFDLNEKVEEYKTVPCLEYILLVDPDYPQVRLYERHLDRNWRSERLVGMDAVVNVPMFDLRLRLSELYAGLEFRPGPTLASPETSPSRSGI